MTINVFAFLLNLFFCENPQTIQGVVYDNDTKQPLSFAVVEDYQKRFYTLTDTLGNFDINTESVLLVDSLRVSLPGYRSVNLVLSSESMIRIGLEKINSKTAQISRFKGKRKRIGAVSSQTGPSFGCYADSNTELALYFENPVRKSARIEYINFFIHEIGIYSTPFRIHIYEVESGLPGREITNCSMLVEGYKVGWNMFNILEESLLIPIDGCFVSMEWLNLKDGAYIYPIPQKLNTKGFGQSINLTREFSQSIYCTRTDGKSWIKSNVIQWNGFTLTNYNPSINLDIVY